MMLNSPLRPLLSIVVTTYTEKRFNDLIDLLKSIKTQQYSSLETVIVIEKSLLLHQKIISFINKENPSNTRVIFSYQPLGICGARNLGVKCSNGDIVAFVDDDAVLGTDWANQIIQSFLSNPDAIGVTGSLLPLWESKSLQWFPTELYWIIGCTAWKNDAANDATYANGANMAFRRKAFDKATFVSAYTKGAHDEGKIGPVGDDREFSIIVKRRTGQRLLYNQKAKIFHKVSAYKLTPKFIRRYSFWQGYSDAMFKRVQKDAQGRLGAEYKLSKSILFNLLPSIIVGFTVNPTVASKRLRVINESSLFFFIGYFSYIFPSFLPLTKLFII